MSILQHALWLGYGNRDTFRGIHRGPLPENRKNQPGPPRRGRPWLVRGMQRPCGRRDGKLPAAALAQHQQDDDRTGRRDGHDDQHAKGQAVAGLRDDSGLCAGRRGGGAAPGAVGNALGNVGVLIGSFPKLKILYTQTHAYTTSTL